MAFLWEPDINIIKKVCQHNIFKEYDSKELVCFCIHILINLHYINSGNIENQFVSCLRRSLFLKIVLKMADIKNSSII